MFSPFLIPRCSVLYLRDTCFDFLHSFFPNNMEGSQGTTTRFGHLLLLNKKQVKKKRYHFVIESLLSKG